MLRALGWLAALTTGGLVAMPAQASPWIVARAEVFDQTVVDRLLLLPDGSVVHLAEMRQAGVYEPYADGDTLVYDVGADRLIVRPDSSPSDVLLLEPLAYPATGPALFADVDVAGGTALYGPSDYFYPSLPGYPFSAVQFDGGQRIVFVGEILAAYRGYQPGPSPYQPDSDNDAVPDAADNCVLQPNGPGNTAQSGPSQYDVDGDGFGNRCDGDLNNDCIVNALDLGVLKLRFFSAGAEAADLNGDGVVNAVDLGLMRTLFFQPPGPSGLGFCGS